MENQLYSYSPIARRPKLELPNGARVAFWIGLNIEHFELGKPSTSIHPGTAGLTPDPLNHGWRDYGTRVGVWRTMEILDKHGLRASVLLNADVCREYPQIIEEGNKRNWAWLAHGKNNSTLQTGMDEVKERAYLTEIVDVLKKSTGKAPKGWLGPALSETFNTPNILEELGLNYVCDWCADDQPFRLNTKQGRMISVPYAIEVNDIPLFLGQGMSGPDFAQLVTDQFDVLYEEGKNTGRVMCLALHPFLIGQPFRSKYLDKALAHIKSHKSVWHATSDEIADWYLNQR
jgi:peptidoglycan/xylan/chitin deacetylase (PgdA/CDA1 family)